MSLNTEIKNNVIPVFKISAKDSGKRKFIVNEKIEDVSEESNERRDAFNKLYDKMWGDLSYADFPSSYIEEIARRTRQSTLSVLNVIEDIKILRDEAKKELFDQNEKLVIFCKTMVDLGHSHEAIQKVANGGVDNLSGEEKEFINGIRESLARSNMQETNIKGPHKSSWGKR